MPNKGDINPATGKAYAVNPATGHWDDNYWAQVVEPMLKQKFPKSPEEVARDIVASQEAKLKEQITFLKDFLAKNPFAFDEVLAREMAGEKYKPYYQEILSDFVEPLQTQIARSFEDEQRLLKELVRQEGIGSKEIKQDTDLALERSREGFAGNGLLGSGIENKGSSRVERTGKATLSDFLTRSELKQQDIKLTQGRARTDTEKLIGQRERDIFGVGREFDAKVAQDVEMQRGTALKKRGLSTLDALTSRFGSPLPEIPNYLNLYNT